MAHDGAAGLATGDFKGACMGHEVITYAKDMEADTRWGHWIVTHDVVIDPVTGRPIRCEKDITVNSGASLSAQVHWGRGEHYKGLEGETKVYVNGHVFSIKEGESVIVPRGSIHFSWNESDAQSKFHEIQEGPLCDELDIMRSADQYKKSNQLNNDDEIVTILLKVARERFETEALQAGFVGQDWMNEVVSLAANSEKAENPFADETFVANLRTFFFDVVKKSREDHQRLTPPLPKSKPETTLETV